MRSAKNQEDQDSGSLAELAYVYGKMRRFKDVQNSIARLADLAAKRYVSPFYFAVAYAALGDRDRAFQYLHKGIEDKTWPMVNLNVDPTIAVLHTDPRWTNIVRQVGLSSHF